MIADHSDAQPPPTQCRVSNQQQQQQKKVSKGTSPAEDLQELSTEMKRRKSKNPKGIPAETSVSFTIIV